MSAQYNLKPVWNAILDVYKPVFEICKKHGLRIFVAYGTEIGAMRHHGFIPWDDDFDVYMPRSDYNRFMELASKELPDYLKWHSMETDPEYNLYFGKVQDTRVDVLERVKRESGLNLEQGVFVDFFPLDGLPATKIGIWLWNFKRSMIRRSFDSRGKRWGISTFVYKVVAKFLPRSAKLYMQNWITRIPYDSSKYVAWTLSTFRYPKFIKRREWFDSVKMVNFEDTSVPVPIGVEYDLTTMYGDYNMLPPVEKRKPAHQVVQ